MKQGTSQAALEAGSVHRRTLDPGSASLPKRNKYGAKKTVLDGIAFDSKAEAGRWATLRIAEKSSLIENLERQPAFKVAINGKHICTYKADFRYLDRQTGLTVVEDVKGVRTPVYRLKKKMVEAFYGIEIVEVKA